MIGPRKLILILVSIIVSGVFVFGQSKPVYPLKASSNKRYLVDQNGIPFIMVGDSPQAMMSAIDPTDMATYLANRQSYGFNTVWVMAPCTSYETGCPASGAAFDGTLPFTSGTGPSTYDLSTPNNAYWTEVDAMVNLCASYGIQVVFNLLETGGWLVTMQNNGNTKTYNFGAYIGNRYKNFPNIIWMSGDDFQTWSTGFPFGTSSASTAAANNALVENLMAGIASADPNHLQTTELEYNISGSQDDSLLVPYTTLDAAYTYYPTYGEVTAQYNAATIPVFMEEGYYYLGDYTNLTPSVPTLLMMRHQAYWTVLAGGLGGYLSGNESTESFNSGWQTEINDVAYVHTKYWGQFVNSFQWWKMVPDQSHTVVTAGYGTATGVNEGTGYGTGNVQTDNYVTTSRASDGSFVLSYCPQSCTITVNMSELTPSQVSAQWYDPTNNSYQTISGSPFANTGSQNFTTPGNNSAGDPDWVLLMQDSASPAPPTNLTATVE